MGRHAGAVDPKRDRRIVALYSSGRRTLGEIGAMFGITRERVRQVLCRAGMTRRRIVPAGYVPLPEVARALGVLPVTLTRALWRLPARSILTRGSGARRKRFIRESAAVEFSAAMLSRACPSCGASFKQPMHEYKHGVCSKCWPRVRYARDPRYRARQRDLWDRWRQKNRERWLAIQRRASAKHRLKKRALTNPSRPAIIQSPKYQEDVR